MSSWRRPPRSCPVVSKTPVLAGVNGTDPFCVFDHFLDRVKAIGFAGVQNFPTRRLDRRHLPGKPGRDRHVLLGQEIDMSPPGPRQGHADDALCRSALARRPRWPRPVPISSSAISGSPTGGAIGAETALKLSDVPAMVDEWSEAGPQRSTKTLSCSSTAGPVAEPGRCRVCAQEHRQLPRLLRCLLYGAAADGTGH